MPYTFDHEHPAQLNLGRSHITPVHRRSPLLSPRSLDSLPGIMTWAIIAVTIGGALWLPEFLYLFAAIFGVYAGIRFFFVGTANITGIRHIQRWERCDWRAYYEQQRTNSALDWDDVLHLVIIPNYNEPLHVLQKTLAALATQYEASQRIIVVLAMEEAEAQSREKADALYAEYSACFARFICTFHPHGLPDELQCKSSNIAWAGRHAKRLLVDEEGCDLDHILVTVMDADTRWHPMTFQALTSLYASHHSRYTSFWQAPIRYHGNIWQISPPMRLINAYASALELAYMTSPGWMPMPMSSYSLSLRLLHMVGYWDTDVIADEWHMFIKAYFKAGGQIQVERVFLPFLAEAPTGRSVWAAVKNRYLQTLRHYWGSKEIGYTIANLIQYPNIPRRRAVRLLFRVTHDTMLSGAGWVLISMGTQLPFVFHEQDHFAGIPGYLAFISLQVVLVMISIMGIVCWYADVLVRPQRDQSQKRGEPFFTLLSFALLPILVVIFITIPSIDAQTRLLAGISLNFRVTQKL